MGVIAPSSAATQARFIREDKSRVPDRDTWIVCALLVVIGATALAVFHSRHEILLSGDAVAHINIARRVVDSRTPGPLQLGSVWLPLPHLLTIPFVLNDRMWQSGIGGSVVSFLAYVAAGLGLFRLLAMWSRRGAWVGAIAFSANPNLIYVQTTALNESLYLASFIWACLFFVKAYRSLAFADGQAGAFLENGAIALTAAILTRYDGWFLALTCWLALVACGVKTLRQKPSDTVVVLRRSVFKALLLTALGPALWMAYNFGVYGNALDFANGPYSAKAISERTTAKGAALYPGEKSPYVAGLYFTKAAQLNIGEGMAAKLLVWIAGFASIVFAVRRDWLPMMLLWSPLIFYSLSIAYGSVPIFLPVWWPYSYYNVRYGLELLPAIAFGIGLSVWALSTLLRDSRRQTLASLATVLLVAGCYWQVWRTTPICLLEVRANGEARLEFDHQLAAVLAALPRNSTILAYTGAHSGAFELAGVPLRRTINEGIFMIWNASLQHPASAADYIVASDNDPVAEAVVRHPSGLIPVTRVHVSGEPQTVIYKGNSALSSNE